MADIQIPQRTAPQATPPAPPYDLVNAGIQRNYQTAQALPNAINDYLDWYNKQQELKAHVFESGGPYLLNQLFGHSGAAQPSQGSAAQAPAAATPTGDNLAPQTAGMEPSGQTPSSSPQIPETIQASLNMGHPDYLGMAQQFAPMGKYGREQIQNLGNMATLEQAPVNMAQKQMEMKKTQGELAMQPTDFALKQQNLANAQQQIPMEIKKTVAGEVSKQSQDTQNITQLKTLAGNLGVALKGHNPGLFGNQAGSLYQFTGGREGDASAAAIQNAANPLATALNTVLARRFSSGEVALLSQSLIPQPKDTPQFAQQKLANLNRLLDSMARGNEANVKNVAAAITSGQIPSLNAPKHAGVLSGDHDAAIQWAQSHSDDPRAQAVLEKAQAALGGQ